MIQYDSKPDRLIDLMLATNVRLLSLNFRTQYTQPKSGGQRGGRPGCGLTPHFSKEPKPETQKKRM